MDNFYQLINGSTTLVIQEKNGTMVNHGVVATTKMFEDNRVESSRNTPGFETLKRFQLPQNPYTRTIWEQNYPKVSPVYKEYWNDGTSRQWFYNGPGTAFYLDVSESHTDYPIPPDLRNQAISRLRSEASNSSGSAAVSMAEADKTARFVAQTATKFANAFRDLRKGRFGDFANTMGLTTTVREERAFRNRYKTRVLRSGGDTRQFAAQTWLEYSYAWKPMISDVYSQAENLARVLENNSFVLRVARSSANGNYRYAHKTLSADQVWAADRLVIVQGRESYTVRYRVPNGPAQVANTFGLTNPLLVAWELVPFSFVADWFLPIGDFLAGLTAWDGLEFGGGTHSSVRKSSHTCTGRAGPGSVFSGGHGQLVSNNWGSATAVYTFKTRELLSNFPSQQSVEFKDPRSFAHAASAIALIQAVGFGSRKGASVLR
jgi:hypothetical protein